MIPRDHRRLLLRLRRIVGWRHLLRSPGATGPYRKGFRFGAGPALAVVRPANLVEQWHILEACVSAGVIVIMQAANTGLTGGSTPFGDDYDRAVVIINTMRIKSIHVIDEGRQVICLAGATLSDLEARLKPFGREPHSVIGSSCLGASVVGGVCNNSGGSLIRRGPAFTDMALYAAIDAAGDLRLVNHLGVDLGDDPISMLRTLERGGFAAMDVGGDRGRRGSDTDYARRVRQVDAPRPARCNADADRLFEASGSAGKVAVFAVRLDTFPADEATRVFYIGTNDPAELTALRRHILERFLNLPVAGEYMHRTTFEVAEGYGKDTFLAVRSLGPGVLPGLFRLKSRLDALMGGPDGRLGTLSDHVLQAASRLWPSHLPPRLKTYRDRFEHHLILKMEGEGVAEAAAHLAEVLPTKTGAFFECDEREGDDAFLLRFAAAGAAIRYRAIHAAQVEGIVALDVAYNMNQREWRETLPDELQASIAGVLYYGHFFCHVFHQDYLVAKGQDVDQVKARLLDFIKSRGATYPAEHNVGHAYEAPPQQIAFFQSLDPTNSFNPGIGKTSKCRAWRRA